MRSFRWTLFSAVLAVAGTCVAGQVPNSAPKPPANPADGAATPASIKQITVQFRKHGLAEASAKPDGAVRIATYNIHDLFDDVDDPALQGRSEDIGRVMIESRRLATSTALKEIDADIVALQEVESLDALKWYRDGWLADLGYTHAAAIDVGHAIGLEQAVLSRYPIIATQTWTDRVIGEHPPLYRGKPNRYTGQPLTFRRSPLMVEVALGLSGDPADLPEADRLTMLVVHAKTGNGSEAWRVAEGEAVAAIISELNNDRPGRRVVVLGEFAVPESEGHLAPVISAGLSDPFAGFTGDPAQIATGIDGKRTCRILLGAGVSVADGSTPFVLGTAVPPSRVERRVGFRMPGFASDRYPAAVDISR